jgi:D-tyrosyl-tRNA(Tyr) deacylase
MGPGLLVLLGIGVDDSPDDIQWLVPKIANLRIFNDDNGVMNRSVQQTRGEVIVVSQFTLLASTKKGNRPSYIKAARPEAAIPLYESFVMELEKYLGRVVGTGVFGADMQVDLCNDGPVTLWIDTRMRE